MPEIDDIINQAVASQSSVSLCIRGDLLAEYDDLTDELAHTEPRGANGSLSDVDPAVAIRQRLADLREEMLASTKKFTFKALGDKASSDLLAKHPSPKNEKGEEEYAFNPDTYPAALVASASLTPKMDEDAVLRLFDVFNLAQRNALFSAALRANNRQVDIPFYAAASEPAASIEQN